MFDFDINKLRLNRVPFQILIKRGNKADINTTVTKAQSLPGELHYAEDTEELFIRTDTENVPIKTGSIETVTSSTHDIANSTTVFDATSNAITATLPDATANKGVEFTLIGYNADNLITIDTTSSQQIRRKSTDTFTSDTLISEDILKVISTGTYWQVTS